MPVTAIVVTERKEINASYCKILLLAKHGIFQLNLFPKKKKTNEFWLLDICRYKVPSQKDNNQEYAEFAFNLNETQRQIIVPIWLQRKHSSFTKRNVLNKRDSFAWFIWYMY